MSQRLVIPLTHPLDPREHGTKAARLARMADLGGRVSPGLVVPARVHALALHGAAQDEEPRVSRDLSEALRAPLDELGPAPWVVRTSAWAEDLPGASAAGLFRSELGLQNVAGVVAAMERCWWAARAQRVKVYLEATNGGTSATTLPCVAILIQRQVRARWAGVLFTRDPRLGADSDLLRCELVRGSTTAVTAGLMDPAVYELDRTGHARPPLPVDAGTTAQELLALAALAEQAAAGPADVELALTELGAVVLQVRPITAYGSQSPTGSPSGVTAPDEDGLSWRWDAEHNPAPLSPLHASLVARLDRLPSLPFRLRCVGGYLYSAARPGVKPPPAESPDQIQRAWPARRLQLEKWLEDLEDLEDSKTEGPEDLEALLSAFDCFYVQYAALAGAPFASSHRRLATQIDNDLARGTLARNQLHVALAGVVSPLTEALTALARQAATSPALVEGLAAGRDVSQTPGGTALESGLATVILRLGALPPVWDVAVPTLAESPAALRRTVAALARTPRRDTAAPPRADPLWLNLAADEEDDLLFARGLAAIRSACLRAGARLVQADRLDHAEDIFRLELTPLLQALGDGPESGLELRTLLAPEPREPPTGPPPGDGPRRSGSREQVVRGFGSGAGTVQAWALVVRRLAGRIEDLAGAAQGRIVVCPSLLPSAVVLLAGAAGIVTDHGGLLSHGAILARELGLPAVLGTQTATEHFTTGDRLWLDAAAGLVIRM